jgi:LPS sulfotransferase NodH
VRLRAWKRKEPARPERRLPWQRLDEVEEYRELCRVRLEHLVPVREPLVLISQIQRSGGTLLSQLFDGHPECHAHPHEIYIGKPKKWDWPPLDLGAPEDWFATLHEPLVSDWVETGYVKDQTERKRTEIEPDAFPFVFSLKLQKAIFETCVGARPVERERDVLDCYFTSYFNAWLDNHNLYTGPKKAVVGFTPRLSMELERVERLFAAYPDGVLISIVRDPRAWFASALRHRKYYRDLDHSIGLWRQSTEAAIEAAERFGGRVFLLTYEELIEDPRATVGAIAERIGVTMTPELLVPTFNGQPIRANSTDAVERHGILPERVTAYRDVLERDTVGRIEELTGDLYERAATLARSRRAEGAVSFAK